VKIRFQRDKFQSAFQLAASIAPTRSPKPILQNVKIEANESETVITATDMEVSVRLKVEGVEVQRPGQAVLPVSRFGALLRESSDESLLIDNDGHQTIAKGARSQFKLGSENPDEFPAVNSFDPTDFIKITSRAFKEMIRRTIFACDTESSRYALGGILLESDEGKLISIGTDGRRLAKMEAACEKHGNPLLGDMTTIVPSRSMQLIERALADDDAPVHLAARSNDFLVRIPHGDFSSRLVEGRFPRWRDVFPKQRQGIKLELPVGPIYSAVRQAAIVTNEDSRGVDLSFANGTLELSSATAEIGESQIELPISYDGEPIVISLDYRYLVDFFRVLSPDKNFTLDIENADAAALVIMPLARDRRRKEASK
jgi:DNA polymerase III subunit beta